MRIMVWHFNRERFLKDGHSLPNNWESQYNKEKGLWGDEQVLVQPPWERTHVSSGRPSKGN